MAIGLEIRSRRRESRRGPSYFLLDLDAAPRAGWFQQAYFNQPPFNPLIDALIVEFGLPKNETRTAAGRPPPVVLAVLVERPLLAELVRAMQSAPDEAIEQEVRDLCDGDW